MIRLTIKNETDYDTRDIRRIVLAGLVAHDIERCKVVVRYRRINSSCLGRAYVGVRRILKEEADKVKGLESERSRLFPQDDETKIQHRAYRATWMLLNLERERIVKTTKNCPECGGARTPRFTKEDHEIVSGVVSNYCGDYFYVPGAEAAFVCIACKGKGMVTSSEAPRDMCAYARAVASTVDHECYHLRGLEHRQFPKHVLRASHEAPWFSEKTMVLRRAEDKPPEVVSLDERRDARLAHAQKMHERATTRLKRAKTIEDKWKRRVKNIEKTIDKAARNS